MSDLLPEPGYGFCRYLVACPLRGCDWATVFTTESEARRHLETGGVVRGHIESHELLEWVQEVIDLRTAARDAAFPWMADGEAPAFEPVHGRPRRNSVTKKHLRDVAEVYRQAVADGLPPTKAVADRFRASHSTAARWVSMARAPENGLLRPVGRGRSGEGQMEATDADPA